jgi:hypothetical protein
LVISLQQLSKSKHAFKLLLKHAVRFWKNNTWTPYCLP